MKYIISITIPFFFNMTAATATPPWYQHAMQACNDLQRGVSRRTIVLMLQYQDTPNRPLTESTFEVAKKATNEHCQTEENKAFVIRILENIKTSSHSVYR